MPTGYTCDIEKGISFKKFVKNCARAFGAYVEFRDVPTDVDVDNELKVETYYKDKMVDKQFELDKVKQMTDEEIIKKMTELHEQSIVENIKYVEEKELLRQKYEAMLEKVKAWNPPSTNHLNLKSFMIEQITGSIDFDCSIYERKPYPITTAEEWRKKEIASIEHDIEYYQKEYDKDVERYKSRRLWIDQLNESLKKEED